MADVKTLTVNNVTYNIKDEQARASLTAVVHKTGAETIGGNKTFSNVIHTVAPAADSDDTSVPTTKWVRDNLRYDYASTDMNNLTDEGANIAEWSSNISNCITEMPINIKCKIENGIFTLLAGSKVCVPNGPGVFTEVTIENDLTFTFTETKTLAIVYDYTNGGLAGHSAQYIRSGSGAAPTGYSGFWYDDVNNKLSNYEQGSVVGENCSLLMCNIHTNASGVCSIASVYDGISFCGSHIFVLPGVKYKCPNGRNSDGTAKSIECTTSQVIVYNAYVRWNDFFFIDSTQNIIPFASEYFYINEFPDPATGYWFLAYDDRTNQYWFSDNGQAYQKVYLAEIGRFRRTGNQNTMFETWETKCAFKPLEKFDVLNMLNMIYPVGSIYLEASNSGFCPLEIVMKGTRWELVSTGKALWTGNGSNANTTIAAGIPNITGGLIQGNYGYKSQAVIDPYIYGAFSYTYRKGATGNIYGGEDRGGQATGMPATFDASRSSPVYRNDVTTVQPPAYVVNAWRRVA